MNGPLDDDKACRENLAVSQKYSYPPLDGASVISSSAHEAAPSMIGAETVTASAVGSAEKLNLNPLSEEFVVDGGADFL